MNLWAKLMSNQDLIDLLAVAAVVAGLSVCLFGLRIWRYALGGVVAAIGWYAGTRVGSMMAVEGTDLLVCAVGGALLLGVVAVLVEMPVIICLSAVSGAWSVVWGVSLYFDKGFHRIIDVWKLTEHRSAYGGELFALALLAAVGLLLQIIAFVRSGPDMSQINHAMDCADLPRKRRIAVLDDLRSDRTISHSEYFRHLIRILSSSSWTRSKPS